MRRKQPDTQRQRVYNWERNYLGDQPGFHKEVLTIEQCRELASQMYGKRVVIKDGRGARAACAYWRNPATLRLPRWARNQFTIAHEVAHLLATRKQADDLPAHGGRFMLAYIRLLHDHCNIDGSLAMADARHAGLRVGKHAPIRHDRPSGPLGLSMLMDFQGTYNPEAIEFP